MTEKLDGPVASGDDHKFTLRLTDGLHQAVEEARKREGRSFNTEILLRLERTFEDDSLAERRATRTHLGLIEFLAGCVEELAELLPDERKQDTKVLLMLELTRSISDKQK